MKAAGRILSYFFREAGQNLLRGWKTSLVAVATITVSLLLCGAAMVAFRNLERAVDGWRREVAVLVYLDPDIDPQQLEDLRFVLAAPRWVETVTEVSAAEASQRFAATFPTLAGQAGVLQGEIFPPSLEADIDPERVEDDLFEQWLAGLRTHESVLMVDADQEWLDELAGGLRMMRAGGLVIGAVLLLAAALTTSSILRLVARLHEDEIAIMRLVGATELYIRGPFYVEGVLQGLLGGALASLGLAVGFRLLPLPAMQSLWTELFLSRSAGPVEIAELVALGAGVGLLGALLSLRREAVGPVRNEGM